MILIVLFLMMSSTPPTCNICIKGEMSFVSQDYNATIGTNMPTLGVG